MDTARATYKLLLLPESPGKKLKLSNGSGIIHPSRRVYEPNTTEGMTENQKKKLDEKRQKDASALSLIQRNVTDPIFPRIMRVESAKEAWETLRNEFQGDHKVRAIKLQSLRKDLENMKMKEDESLKDYSSRFLELINQMTTHDEDISDRRIVEKTLISLPEKFDPIIAVIEETKDLSTLSVQEVMASLKSYEQRMARHTEKAVESAFQSKLNVGSKSQERKPQNFDQPKGESSRGGRYGRGRGRNRGRGRGNFGKSYNSENNSKPYGVCKKMSHDEKDCWLKGQPQCHRCKKFGRVQKDCRVKLHQQASFTEEKGSEASLFYACQSATEKNDEMWFLDSGCSNHMAREKSLFLDMDSTVNTKVKLGNGTIVQAQGKGSIGVQTKQGTRFIRDVLLVPDLEHNLLSLGQLLENDYTLQFQDKCCIIYDKKGSKDVVTKIKIEKNRSFPINFRYTSGVAMKASIVEDSWLWYRRFGHINFKNLKLLHKENMVQGLPTIEEKHEVCEGCAFGKHHRQPFPKGVAWRAKEKLEIVHTDVCGPMQTLSNAENRWFLLEHPLEKSSKSQSFGELGWKPGKQVQMEGADSLHNAYAPQESREQYDLGRAQNKSHFRE
ncbi:hypothetical protein RJ639_021063 [Escallonia herrerae]|uniref:Uncharacterized protein n=1 Tax=Escallonia herrerae TaxID=1293975 RepID=A0AA88V2G2_9ASTE|nr:hypothetical protein RJ639_021063 [Escallonia herrerae]